MAVPARFRRLGARILMDSRLPASAAAQRAGHCQRSFQHRLVCLKYRRKLCLCFWQVHASRLPCIYREFTGAWPEFLNKINGRRRDWPEAILPPKSGNFGVSRVFHAATFALEDVSRGVSRSCLRLDLDLTRP